MTQNLTIGFIGYGNMAQAIAQGFVDAGVVTGGQMVACAAHYDKLEKTTAELGLRPLRNALEVVTAADVVIIAIKPYQIAAVVKPLADALAEAGQDRRLHRRRLESQEVPGPVRHRRRRIRRLFGHSYPVHHSEHSDGRGQGRARHRIRQHPDRRRNRNLRAAVRADQPHRARGHRAYEHRHGGGRLRARLH